LDPKQPALGPLKAIFTTNFKMCIALALCSMKKKKDGQKAQEENVRVVSANRPESPSSRVPPQVSQDQSYGGNQNGKPEGMQ
jgi:hypothetical protein